MTSEFAVVKFSGSPTNLGENKAVYYCEKHEYEC